MQITNLANTLFEIYYVSDHMTLSQSFDRLHPHVRKAIVVGGVGLIAAALLIGANHVPQPFAWILLWFGWAFLVVDLVVFVVLVLPLGSA